jgi:hypothetical protein
MLRQSIADPAHYTAVLRAIAAGHNRNRAPSGGGGHVQMDGRPRRLR